MFNSIKHAWAWLLVLPREMQLFIHGLVDSLYEVNLVMNKKTNLSLSLSWSFLLWGSFQAMEIASCSSSKHHHDSKYHRGVDGNVNQPTNRSQRYIFKNFFQQLNFLAFPTFSQQNQNKEKNKTSKLKKTKLGKNKTLQLSNYNYIKKRSIISKNYTIS